MKRCNRVYNIPPGIYFVLPRTKTDYLSDRGTKLITSLSCLVKLGDSLFNAWYPRLTVQKLY